MWSTIVVVALLCLVDLSVQWSGPNVCSRTDCIYRRERRCSYTSYGRCCAWTYISVPVYITVQFCCKGWRGTAQRCNIAICNPSCLNGGQCVAPNTCRCNDGAIGSTCNVLVCNYKRPCFPGVCTPTGSGDPSCQCTTGFEHLPGAGNAGFCQKLKSDQAPAILEIHTSLGFYDAEKKVDAYILYVDSTNSTTVGKLWTNRERFNKFNFKGTAQYINADMDVPPSFIKSYRIGIVSAEINFLLTKKKLTGIGTDIAENFNETCSPSMSSRNPTADLYTCSLDTIRIYPAFSTDDVLSITFKTTSGGFRQLQRVEPTQADRGFQDFSGPTAEKVVMFRFDYSKPTHQCLQEDDQCLDTFYLHKDITKEPLDLRWSDWEDVPSGVFRYSWEVFKLEADGNNVLLEKKPLEPISAANEVLQSSSTNNKFQATYTPVEAGVYSIILEVSDKANNSMFIRRIVQYDPTSTVTIDTSDDRRLFVTSANTPVYGNKYWQNSSLNIEITWTNHFANLVHESGLWLNSVLKYPKLLENGRKDIPYESLQDDHEGHRTVNAIDNRRGIVSFEVAYAKNSGGGQSPTEPDDNSWSAVGLNENYTLSAETLGGLSQLDTVTVWIKATDIMGNSKVDKTSVNFDDTNPISSTPTFKMNVLNGEEPFSSTVDVVVLDMESGLRQYVVEVRNKANELLRTETEPFQTINTNTCSGQVGECYCPARLSGCYYKTQHLMFSNCWLIAEREGSEIDSFDVTFIFMNMAGLQTSKSITIDKLSQLNGTQAYFGPKDLAIKQRQDSSVIVTWKHSPSCYERTEMWINYNDGNGAVQKTKLHPEAIEHTVNGLQSGSEYTLELISQYGQIMSQPVTIHVPAYSSGTQAGLIAGVVSGVLLLLIIVGLLLFLFVFGGLAMIRNRRKKYVETPALPTKNRFSHAFENTTYTKDDELYIYSCEDLGDAWIIPPDDITLLEEIATGRFAKVYKARWTESPKNVKDVAVKMLKDRDSPNDVLLMMAKINFAATQVGSHNNIVDFYGSIMDNAALGPVLVMEYCEYGPMDKWLSKQKSKINEETLDMIQNFALQVARAMEYLATKGIVHKKLAARNCYLTFLKKVKLSGFGPCSSDEQSDDKGDRIPIKWTAPENVQSLKNADEKSDIWSYGVTMWEIFSMGDLPYSNVRGRDLPAKIKGGLRLTRPEYAEDLHYQIMENCWTESPAGRPKFSSIVTDLEASFGLQSGNDSNYYYRR